MIQGARRRPAELHIAGRGGRTGAGLVPDFEVQKARPGGNGGGTSSRELEANAASGGVAGAGGATGARQVEAGERQVVRAVPAEVDTEERSAGGGRRYP